ncbi:MAG: hypothetical protein KF812_11355 [Fimbriimonadaceae bacterium]|nr:hypothetical protein [Fimbriimonadaceae bacterium]
MGVGRRVAFLLVLSVWQLSAVGQAQSLPYMPAGPVYDTNAQVTDDWHLAVTIELTDDAFPISTTTETNDGWISGTGTLATVSSFCARLPSGNPNATIPTLLSVHIEIDGVEHEEEVSNPTVNSGAVAMRFASTHFAHLSSPLIEGYALFEHEEQIFPVEVSLTPTVYNKLAGWYHGDPGWEESEWTLEKRQLAATLFRLMAEDIYGGFKSSSSHYSADGGVISALDLSTATDRIKPSTGLLMVTHGSPNSVELCTDIGVTVQSMVSGDMSAAWDDGLVTPQSHFAIAIACETVFTSGGNKTSDFKNAIRTRSVGGAYLGYDYEVPSLVWDNSQDPPVPHTLPEHLAELMESLELGMCVEDAVAAANEGGWFSISFVGDPLATFSTVYLTQSERAALSGNRTYPHWYHKL